MEIKTKNPVSLPSSKPNAIDDAKKFGVHREDKVYLIVDEAEVLVGEYKANGGEDVLEIFARRYLDLADQLELFEYRLKTVNLKPGEIDKFIVKMKHQIDNPNFVGNLQAVMNKFESIVNASPDKKVEYKQHKQEAVKRSIAMRSQLVARAEQLVANKNMKTGWKKTADSLEEIFDKWSYEQKFGPKIDKQTMDALWKRLIMSRRVFEKQRREFFKNIDVSRKHAKEQKAGIILKAKQFMEGEQLGNASRQFKEWMDEWKSAGAAKGSDDNKLWLEFKEIQDSVFNKVRKGSAEKSEKFEANFKVKQGLVAQAKKITFEDAAKARKQLRDLQHKIAAVGPAGTKNDRVIYNSIQKISEKINESELEEWKANDPTVTARVTGFVKQLESKIAELKAKIEGCESDEERKPLQEELDSASAWLAHITKD